MDQPDQPYYDYRDENDLPLPTPSQSQTKQIPPPNNSPVKPSNPTQNPNDPKEYNYHYDKVDDKDPNHITAVHKEAHQTAFKYDNSDDNQQPPISQSPYGAQSPYDAQPPYNAQSPYDVQSPDAQTPYDSLVPRQNQRRPPTMFQQSAPTSFNRRYPNQIPINRRPEMTLYPNSPMINPNLPINNSPFAVKPDLNQYQPNDIRQPNSFQQPANSANDLSLPQATDFIGGTVDDFFSNGGSPRESDFNKGPYFHDFLKRFKFYPRTAGKW